VAVPSPARPGGGAGKEGGKPGGGGLLSFKSGRIKPGAPPAPAGEFGGGGGACGAAQLNFGGGGGGGGAPAAAPSPVGGVGKAIPPSEGGAPNTGSAPGENNPGGGAGNESLASLAGPLAPSFPGIHPAPVLRSDLGVIGLIETDFSSSALSVSASPKIKSSGGIEKDKPDASFPSFLSLEEALESFLPVLSLFSSFSPPLAPCRFFGPRIRILHTLNIEI